MTEGYRPPPYGEEPRSRRAVSIPVFLLVTILTLGLFNIYWNYRQMQDCNELLGRDEFSFGMWFLLCLITCFLYHIYYQYRMGVAINEIQQSHDMPEMRDLPIVSLLCALFGLGIVADCIHQNELNKIDLEMA